MTNVDDLPYVDPGESGDRPKSPGSRARCVDCDMVLIAKCGEISVWHWAHESGGDICIGSGGEGAWHRAWKAWAELQGATTEVIEGTHRADIMWPDGRVYEMQSTYLSAVDIRKREDHWGDRLTWIYRFTPGRWDRLTNIGEGWFVWRRPATSMALHERPVIWHHRERLYQIEVRARGNDIHIKFAAGEADEYGPVMYGSDPAPFCVDDSIAALNGFSQSAPLLPAA